MKAQIVSFHCVLRDQLGKVISSTFNHDVITHVGGDTARLPGLSEGLQNLRKGEKRRICLSADRAYGFYDPKLVIEVPLKQLPHGKTLQSGQELLSKAQDGRTRLFRVVEIHGKSALLDGNHPLAGQDLVFEIETTEARDATSEEIAESSEGAPTHLH